MSAISSLSAMVSALSTSQQALNTTAHNLSNVNTTGYVRQQSLIKEARYQSVGRNATTGFYVGLGTDTQAIRQVRDRFLDDSFREEQSRYGFYNAKNNGIEEIETILGEIEGESFKNVLNDLWTSLNELSKHPNGLETRGAFIENAVLFIDRANLTMDQMNSYQNNLNNEIADMVNQVNDIGKQIYQLNDIILKQELSGGNANDYRDQRNLLLDDLSKLVNISYKEDLSGNLLVKVENRDFVMKDGYNTMGLEPAEPKSLMFKPIWNHVKQGDNSVYNLSTTISPENENDKGALKGLLLARGSRAANWTDLQNQSYYETNIKPSVVMNAQAQFDNLIHGVVTMINNVVAPNRTAPPITLDTANAPFGLDGSQGIEIFSRSNTLRYNPADGTYIPEDANNPYTLYSAGNLRVNPQVLQDYNKICVSGQVSDTSDNSFVEEILNRWKAPFSSIEPGLSTQLNFNEYYNDFVSNMGNVGSATRNQMDNQQLMVLQIDNKRNTLTGVSSDEELGNMIKYQHAYNAAAKVVTILDQMIEQVVASTGLVGR